MAYEYVLFPGRHHLLTRFQAAYLERAVAVGVPDTEGEQADCRGAQVVFAVTSADHGTTRRNPLPAHRREAQIERYAALSAIDCLVFPVDDVPQTEPFAEYLLAAIAVQEGAMHPASAQLWERYGLLGQVRRAHADPLLTDEGELTETRDYNTYARAFDTGAARKWAQLCDVVRPGRIVA